MNKKLKIIINADDLGISSQVNKAIEYAIQKGRISSSTILVNGDDFDGAVRIAKSYPNISFGIHLNLIEFVPLTNRDVFSKYGLLNIDGRFQEGAIFLLEDFPDDLCNAIYDEWMAQINKLRRVGINPTHIDSHQHTHNIYQLSKVLIKVIVDSEIYVVRRRYFMTFGDVIRSRRLPKTTDLKIDKTLVVFSRRKSFLQRRLLQLKNYYITWRWVRILKRYAKMTDYFLDYRTFSFFYKTIYRQRKYNVVELMCHPGHDSYFTEYNLVLKDELRKNIPEYELISYKDIF